MSRRPRHDENFLPHKEPSSNLLAHISLGEEHE